MRRAVSVTLIVLTVAGLTLTATIDFGRFFSPYGPLILTYLAVGGLLTWRAGSNSIGWLVLGVTALSGAGLGARALGALAASPIGAGWADAVGNAMATAGIMLTPVALLRFPDGRLLSARWRWVERGVALASVVGAAASILNGGWGGDVEQAIVPSPVRAATAPLGDGLSSVFYPMLAVVMVLSGVSVIRRYRRSAAEERLQMKWLAYAAGLLLATFLVMAVVSGNSSADEPWQEALVVLALAGVPLAMGVAILKYRLYDIDIVISRTVVLALLAGFITAVYAVIVVFIGDLIGSGSDGLFLPIVATGVVALAFEPVRHTVSRWANHLVYGRRATPYEVLSDLITRLSRGEQGEGLLSRMAILLSDGTGAERATIWLGGEHEMRVAASWPMAPDAGTLDPETSDVFEVTNDGVMVGAFEVVKPRGIALSTSERSLIADLAGSAGAVLGYQRLNDSLQEKAQELTESRLRLVDAQDIERRRFERDLHDGAQQLIVSLKVKIGLARAMAAERSAFDLESLLGGLADEAQQALEEVRALAKGIYPPVLESDGLPSAISALASGAAQQVLVAAEGLGRYGREVEATVYFEISEAVTNAVKHANGPIRVGLEESDGTLRFAVADSGPGFDVTSANGGSGLQNLRDRIDAIGGVLEIQSRVGGGTTVRGEVPLEPASTVAARI